MKNIRDRSISDQERNPWQEIDSIPLGEWVEVVSSTGIIAPARTENKPTMTTRRWSHRRPYKRVSCSRPKGLGSIVAIAWRPLTPEQLGLMFSNNGEGNDMNEQQERNTLSWSTRIKIYKALTAVEPQTWSRYSPREAADMIGNKIGEHVTAANVRYIAEHEEPPILFKVRTGRHNQHTALRADVEEHEKRLDGLDRSIEALTNLIDELTDRVRKLERIAPGANGSQT